MTSRICSDLREIKSSIEFVTVLSVFEVGSKRHKCILFKVLLPIVIVCESRVLHGFFFVELRLCINSSFDVPQMYVEVDNLQ